MRGCASRSRLAWVSLLSFLGTLQLASAFANLTPLKLRVGGREIALKIAPVSDGREVYIPLEALQAFDLSYSLNRREDAALITFPSGDPAEIALARPGGHPMAPLSALESRLQADILMAGSMCDVRARILKMAFDKEGLRVTTGFPVDTNTDAESGPHPSITLHLPGTSLPSSFTPPSLPAGDPRIVGIKAERTSSGVRIRLELAFGVSAKADGGGLRRNHLLVLAGTPSNVTTRAAVAAATVTPSAPQIVQKADSLDGAPSPTKSQPESSRETHVVKATTVKPAPASPVQNAEGPDTAPTREMLFVGPPEPRAENGAAAALKPAFTGIRITDVSLLSIDAFHARLRIKTTAKPVASVKLLSNPSRLAIDIPNSMIECDQRDWTSEHPFLSAVHAQDGEKPGNTRIVLDLARLVGYKVLPAADGLAINLSLPRGVGRKMKDIIVVVDAGHGGPAKGCSIVFNGQAILEKNITLSIATYLRQLLEDAGVNVIMTRTKDEEIGLKARPGLANDNNADLFLSIHVDDCGIPNTGTGSTAYYHFDDESSRAFAHSLIERVAQVSGLPNRGARSDRVLYSTGLAVLRYSAMPAVLVETAYINNSRDRQKLLDKGFHLKVAQALFDGIRAYVEGALPEDDLGPMSTISGKGTE